MVAEMSVQVLSLFFCGSRVCFLGLLSGFLLYLRFSVIWEGRAKLWGFWPLFCLVLPELHGAVVGCLTLIWGNDPP